MHASYNLKYGKIKNEREVLMTKTEVIQRLQKDLEAYFTNYVSNVSADFEGGLDNK